MVFDNCQIDVFFHMRSHYNRLRSVQSVVDCSPPKALKRSSHSDSSFQNVEMANLPKHSYGTKNKHSCGYGLLTDLVTPDGHNTSSKTRGLPPRPKTRRKVEDLPHCTLGKYSRSTGNKSSRPRSKHPLECIGYLNKTPKSYKHIDVNSKNINLTARTLENVSCPSTRNSHPNTTRSIRKDKTPPPCKSSKPCTPVHSEGGKVTSTCTTPKKYLLCNGTNPSLEDHEYLQFLLRITEDIIKNDLYSNEEMKKVFTNHVKANKDRLDLNRMLLRIHELMKELNIPLGIDVGENPSASWTDLETTMKSLLCLEKEESLKQEGECKTEHSPKQKCICFDLRAMYPLVNPTNNIKGEKIENLNNESDTPTKTFRATSLDRLTEHTEPLSSRATCKISTSFSNFGDVEVLPGFECLETPKVSAGVLCELLGQQTLGNSIRTTVCHCHSVKKISKSLHGFECLETPKILARVLCELYRKKNFLNTLSTTACQCQSIKKKTKKRKRKLKKRKNVKITLVKHNKTDENKTNNNTQNTEENLQDKTAPMKYTEKPIIIPIQESNIQTIENESYQKNPSNDYVLIRGPIYLLKAYLDENPQMLINKELESNLNTLIFSKISPHVNVTNLIDNMTSTENTGDSEVSYMRNTEKNEPNNREENKETERIEDTLISTTEYNSNGIEDNKTISSKDQNDPIVMSKDEKKSIEVEINEKNSISKDMGGSNDKFQEIRNILLELTNFPMISFTSVENEREQTLHFYDLNNGCGRSDTSMGVGNNYLCKIKCPNKETCEELRLLPTETPHPKENEMKSLSDEYDYTPQKEENPKNVYLTQDVMQDFLTTREIQTEDIPHNPTIVGAVLISQDKITDTDPADSEIELNQSGPDEHIDTNTNQEAPKSDPPTDDFFATEKEIIVPKTYNLLMAAKPSDPLDEPHHIFPEDIQSYASDSKMPIVSSIQTNATFGTLKSTATVEPNKTFQEIEERIIGKPLSRLFLHGTHDVSNGDSKEGIHNRKVSILKNPIVQVPVDKVFSENDESKKKGESIIRAVESVKDRQMARDPFLDKVLQGIESSRENRAPEKTTNSDASEILALPGPSALKNTGKGSYYPSDDIDDNEFSYDETPISTTSAGRKDTDTETVEESAKTPVSSSDVSEHSLTNFDDQPEVRGTPSQINQINRVNAKLDQLRLAKGKDESEISDTLDKLVETLKKQQETEDQIQVKSDETERKNISSNRKRTFKCCGFCKKKKTPIPIPFNEPAQSTFSEEDYKAKSDAFERALASLGQRPKSAEILDQKKRISKASDDKIMRKMDDYFGPSPIVHSGNRLSLVRIADEKENDLKVLNDDFEDISTKISTDKVRVKKS